MTRELRWARCDDLSEADRESVAESPDDPCFEEQLRPEKLESARELLDFVRTVGRK